MRRRGSTHSCPTCSCDKSCRGRRRPRGKWCHINKTEQKVERNYLRKIGFPEDEIETAKFYKGAGCEACRQLGYQGRMGIYELLLLNEAIRPLILNRAPSSTIAQRAIEQGMRTLRYDGWTKVKAGLTTIEEVLRVTQTEEHLAALVGDDKSEVWVSA